jgi:hypothetical protein
MKRLTSTFEEPAASFLLRAQRALFATTSDQPLSAQALDMVRRVAASDLSLFAALDLPAGQRPPAAVKAWSTAAELLTKCELRSWVVRCNDAIRFAPSTSLLLDHWQERQTAWRERAQTAPSVGDSSRTSRSAACRWRQTWGFRWGRLRCRDAFREGELLQKAPPLLQSGEAAHL